MTDWGLLYIDYIGVMPKHSAAIVRTIDKFGRRCDLGFTMLLSSSRCLVNNNVFMDRLLSIRNICMMI